MIISNVDYHVAIQKFINYLIQPYVVYLYHQKKNVRSQKYYKSIIPAAIPQKQNSKCQYHPDFHLTCAQVNYVQELVSLYNDECISLSCDNKAKIPLGIPAVSRYVRSRKFHLLDQSPNLPDHDFPKAGVKITPAIGIVEE